MKSNNRQRLRQFIQSAFSDEELGNFCFDYFPQIYNEFTTGMPKSQKVRMLVAHAERGHRLLDLHAALKRENPRGYDNVFPKEGASAKPEAQQPITRNPRQVFISYASEDAGFARRLVAYLRTQGWRIWIAPESINPGEKWVEAINRGLAESGVFVLVMTKKAIGSRWVQTETNAAIGMANRGELRFIPLELEEVNAPALWQAYQWISFCESYGRGLSTLVNVLDPEIRAESSSIKPKELPLGKPVRNAPVLAARGQRLPKNRAENRQVSKTILSRAWHWLQELPLFAWVGGVSTLTVLLLIAFWLVKNLQIATTPVPTQPAVAQLTPTDMLTVTRTPVEGSTMSTIVEFFSSRRSLTPTPSRTPTKRSPTQVPSLTPSVALPTQMLPPTSTRVLPTPTFEIPTLAPTATSIVVSNRPPANAALGDTWIRPIDGMAMVYVPPPDVPFLLEDDLGAPSTGYWIDRYEVSNAQYRLCEEMGSCVSSSYANDPSFNGDNLPVVGVSVGDAKAYSNWVGGSLPTEAEWKYAAFGKSNADYPWGNEFDWEKLNFCDVNCERFEGDENWNDGYQFTAPVNSFFNGSSWVGALNMAGNVSEWTTEERVENDVTYNVAHGGSWRLDPITTIGVKPTSRSSAQVGFRVVVYSSSSVVEP